MQRVVEAAVVVAGVGLAYVGGSTVVEACDYSGCDLSIQPGNYCGPDCEQDPILTNYTSVYDSGCQGLSCASGTCMRREQGENQECPWCVIDYVSYCEESPNLVPYTCEWCKALFPDWLCDWYC